MSPEHCLNHVQPGVREYMADWPRMRCELIVECPEHGAVFYVRRGFVEARN